MDFVFEAELREAFGRGASRRLRRLGERIPGIIYGEGGEVLSISLIHDKVLHANDTDEFYVQDLTIKIGSKTEIVRIKAIQRHAYKPKILHVDFVRV